MVSSVRSASAWLQRRARGLGKAAPGLALAVVLAGCGDTSVGSSFMSFMPGNKPAEAPTDPKEAAKYIDHPVCPNAEIRYGTESVGIFDGNKQGTPDALKFQISVQRVARDCDQVGENIVARVGAAGRVIAGPKGATGKVDVPVRIAAVNGDKVLYTGLKVVSVQVEAPDFGANWVVEEAVTIPVAVSADTIIYVGLDDKSKAAAPKEKADKAPAKPHKPRPPADPADPYPQMKPNIQ